MRYFYDTEFLENGRTIDLISIGIVAQDGREYYAENRDAPWMAIIEHPYIAASVQLCREVAKSMLAAKPVKEESNG